MGPRLPRRALLAAVLVPAAAPALSKEPEPRGTGPNPDDVPFAEHRLALQLSDRDLHKHGLVLSVANNILKVYGPDQVAIEVVAFGPGVDLLRAESPDRIAVDSLAAQNVRFDVCMNTIDTIERETGHRPVLNPRAVPVEAGVAQLMRLAEAGYTLVRP